MWFLLCDAMLAQHMLWPHVCPSQACTVPK